MIHVAPAAFARAVVRGGSPSCRSSAADAACGPGPRRGAAAAGREQAAAELEKPPTEAICPGAVQRSQFGPQYTIERIVVRGNRKDRSALILGEIGLRAGDQLTASDGRVEAARIRLLSLGYFLDARLALEKGTGRGGLC